MKTGPKPQTIIAWQAKLDALHGACEYTILDTEYVSNSALSRKYHFRHSCGVEFTALLGSLLASVGKGARCPCQRKKVRRDEDTHRTELRVAHGNNFELVSWAGSGNSARHTYRHVSCSQTFERYALNAVQRAYCPHCHGANANLRSRITPERVQRSLDATHGEGEYEVTRIEHVPAPAHYKHHWTQFRATLRHSCGYEFAANRDSFRYGAHTGRCAICYGASRKTREVVYGGKTFRVLGYEERALQDLLKRMKPANIMSRGEEGFPTIFYRYKIPRRYYPDFYVRSTKTIIEVKSSATAGLVPNGERWFDGLWDLLKAKAKKCIKDGYKFKLMLYISEGGELRPVDIPKNWLSLSKHQMAAHAGISLLRRKKLGS